MTKKEIDRHEAKRVSFTFLADPKDLERLKSKAKKFDRTRGSLIREAIRASLEGPGQ